MTYGYQTTAATRFDFGTIAQCTTARRRAERKKLARLRILKRAVHFLGFLSFWALVLSITYLVGLAVMIALVCLA